MITFALLLIITILVVGIALSLISVGGTVLIVLASDLIVAIGIIWLIVKIVRKKK